MSVPVLIRDATSADAAPLAEFGARVFSDTYAAVNTREDLAQHLGRTYTPELQAREIADPTQRFLVATVDGAIAGYSIVAGGPAPAAVLGPRPCGIKRLYVDQKWHGRGIAAALMQRSREHAAAIGAQTLWLMTWEHNARARAFYAKVGFTDVGSATFTFGSTAQVDRVFTLALRSD